MRLFVLPCDKNVSSICQSDLNHFVWCMCYAGRVDKIFSVIGSHRNILIYSCLPQLVPVTSKFISQLLKLQYVLTFLTAK